MKIKADKILINGKIKVKVFNRKKKIFASNNSQLFRVFGTQRKY